MKSRELSILYAIIHNDGMAMPDLLNCFHVSKRTIYYDIANINREIHTCGQIRKVKQRFTFCGDYELIQKFLQSNGRINFFQPVTRRDYVLLMLLECRFSDIEYFYQTLNISKNTRINDFHNVQKYLQENGFQYCDSSCNTILGCEVEVRNLYLTLMQKYKSNCKPLRCIVDFNNKYNLQLTDDALSCLSYFSCFVRARISQGFTIRDYRQFQTAVDFPYYHAISYIIKTNNVGEQTYLAAYIASLSSRKLDIKNDLVERYLDKLISEFETKTALHIEFEEEFKNNIRHHMVSLYYRSLYRFPTKTGVDMMEIGMEQEPLYKIIKTIVQQLGQNFPVFQNLTNNEIYYLTAYFGGYLASQAQKNTSRKKVLLVCPHGLTVSKTLQFQLAQYIPAIEIIDTIAINQLDGYIKYYDAIICTVELPGRDHVIVVNPILTKLDIQKIMKALYGVGFYSDDVDLKQLIKIIEDDTTIHDKKKLKNDLVKLFYRKTDDERIASYMLKDLITPDKIRIVDHVDSWEEGIQLAALPLVEDHSIEPSYITAMIDSVYKYGPYIVLDNYFALPHAKANVGVNRLGMSLMVVKNEVDLMGNPVNIFLVLAAVDTTSHLNALGTLSDILCDRKNIETFRSGDRQKILSLINQY